MRPFIAVAALALSACAATPPVYGPAANGEPGYSDFKIEDDRIRVSYQGAAGQAAAEVEAFAFRRAAELAQADGAAWFRVIFREVEDQSVSRDNRTSVGVSGAAGSGGYSGVGVGLGFDLTPDRPKFAVHMEIITGRGETPEGDDIYTVDGVLGQTVQ
ncbi:MAG: hypothetical protein AAF719_02715 [Pseudomonadota bacterium]